MRLTGLISLRKGSSMTEGRHTYVLMYVAEIRPSKDR